MRLVILLTFLVVISCTSAVVLAQPRIADTIELHTTSKKAIRLYDEGLTLFNRRYWSEAEDKLRGALKADPNFPEAALVLGRLLRVNKTDQAAREESILLLKRYLSLQPDGNQASSTALLLAKDALAIGNYRAADSILPYAKASLLNAQETKDKNYITQTIDFVKSQPKARPVNATPLPPQVNCLPHQYNPVICGDNRTLFFIGLGERNAHATEDIYFTQKDSLGRWSGALPIPGDINTPNGSEGCLTLSADGRTMVFAACDRRDSKGSCDLYWSQLINGSWTKPRNIEELNSPHWESQPSLSADGRELYFVSKRPGGNGMADIYVTTRRTNSSWNTPENLGPHVNSDKDDLFPFVHASGQVLYFSSNGHPGFGGLDVFYSTRKDEGWSSPTNLGPDINSFKNEAGLTISPNGRDAYFFESSIRDQYQRIMTFPIPGHWKVKPKTLSLQIRTLDALTQRPVASLLQVTELSKDSLAFSGKTEESNGWGLVTINPNRSLGLFISADGYIPQSRTFRFTDTLPFNTLTIMLPRLKKGERATLSNIFFDFNAASLKPESQSELNHLVMMLKANPSISINIEGHTDEIGSEQANLQLSTKRANAVVSYLVSKGIQKQRLFPIGLGKTKPLKATGEAEQLNRRIEFEIR